MSVSRWAAPYVETEYEEPVKDGFEAFRAKVAESQRDARARMHDSRVRALRWGAYSFVSFLIATHTPGWWSFTFWCSMMIWGTGAIFQLEAANVARICSTLPPDD
jgi:hypothetical protein